MRLQDQTLISVSNLAPVYCLDQAMLPATVRQNHCLSKAEPGYRFNLREPLRDNQRHCIRNAIKLHKRGFGCYCFNLIRLQINDARHFVRRFAAVATDQISEILDSAESRK